MLRKEPPQGQQLLVITFALLLSCSRVAAVSLHHRVRQLLVEQQGQHAKEDFVPRIALFKQPRSGSSLLFDQLQEAACSRGGTCEHWQREINCSDSSCFDNIKAATNCTGPDGCGFSLNLFKGRESRWAHPHWNEIVDVLAERPITVIFLTRQDKFSQAISVHVALRRELELWREYGHQHPCGKDGGYHFEKCPKKLADAVNERIEGRLPRHRVQRSMGMFEDSATAYQKIEQDLRSRNYENVHILNVTYEDLYDGHWEPLFEAVGDATRTPPVMFDSDYSKFITNLEALTQWNQTRERGNPALP